MHIAIVKLSALGDIVHSMIVLQFIKKNIPNIKIDWITEEAFSQLLLDNPHLDNIKTLNLKSIKKQKKLIINEFKKIKFYQKERYDLIIDLQGLIKSALVCKALGRFCVGFDRVSTREGFASYFYNKTFRIPYEENIIIRNMELVSKALGFKYEKEEILNKEPFLFFKSEDLREVEKYVDGKRKNVLFMVGSSWDSKIYPKEKFTEIAKALDENVLVCWGNEKEREAAEFISQNSGAKILPKLDIGKLKALVSLSDLTIGADSGPTHMAWALNRPSITVFGPTPSFRNAFVTPINITVDCGKIIDPKRLNKKDECIKSIDSSIIIKEAEKLLYG